MRTDRFLTIQVYAPLARLQRVNKRMTIPVLMYHSISENRSGNVHPYYEQHTTPDMFEKQMRFLYENNYKVISLEDIYNVAHENPDVNSKYVVITFDDGYKDVFHSAFPVMKKYDFTATVFLAVDYVGKTLNDKDCLNWSEIERLGAQGIRFGSHTLSHAQLIELDDNQLRWELEESKRILENRLGKPVYAFAYPYAFPEQNKAFTGRLQTLLTDLGYRACVTTIIGNTVPEKQDFFLRRLPVNRFDDLVFFEHKLAGHYDWIHPFQYLVKRIKHFI